eukprot:12564896-Alexandrium_andersonii.AAC.1
MCIRDSFYPALFSIIVSIARFKRPTPICVWVRPFCALLAAASSVDPGSTEERDDDAYRAGV